MKFQEVSSVFSAIAATSSRTEITELLASLLKKASAEEARSISYLSLGMLRPPYEGTQFSLADRSMKKILADLLDLSEEKVTALVRKTGDIGEVLTQQATWHVHTHLTVREVFDALEELEHISGKGSQEERAQEFSKLLKKLEPEGAGLVLRIVLGKLRLGFSDMTLIDALSWMLTGDKSLHQKIEHAYNMCADIGHIAYLLKKHEMKAFEQVDIVVGIPIRPALAERLPTAQAIIEKIGHCVAQPKLDGFRLQVHIDNRGNKRKILFFSRNLQNMSAMFPELVEALNDFPATTCILEGEAILYDEATKSFAPFQETVKRKRKHNVDEMAKEFPLRLFAFDLLYLDGQSLLNEEHETRRHKLVTLIKKLGSDAIQVDAERPITTAKELEDYFLEEVSAGLEGLVVKRPHAHYQPGKRNFNWIKLKRQEHGDLEDTLDTVILGYYAGRGKRARFGIGAFLVGVYNKKQDRFETVAKVGSGLTDIEWHELKKNCDALAVKHQPHNIACSKDLAPDVWVEPSIVVMIRADEITRSPVHTAGQTKDEPGFALRFPRMMGYRSDKSATETTTTKELLELFEHQRSLVIK